MKTKNDIEVKISTDSVRTCNSCGARNYEPCIKIDDGMKKVDIIYELCISNMRISLCKDCLEEVRRQCEAAQAEAAE